MVNKVIWNLQSLKIILWCVAHRHKPILVKICYDISSIECYKECILTLRITSYMQ